MSQLTYTEELRLLADELQADDRSLTRAEALTLAREAMQGLCEYALAYCQAVAAQRPVAVQSA